MFVESRAEPNVALRLSKMFIKPLHPCRVILVQVLVELVQYAEVRARRATNDEKRIVLSYYIPSPLTVPVLVEIKSIRQIKRAALN